METTIQGHWQRQSLNRWSDRWNGQWDFEFYQTVFTINNHELPI